VLIDPRPALRRFSDNAAAAVPAMIISCDDHRKEAEPARWGHRAGDAGAHSSLAASALKRTTLRAPVSAGWAKTS
jgi:hypothetical protein